ncbi:20780_t:CDS:1, partial [Dentiscutata erythropus]
TPSTPRNIPRSKQGHFSTLLSRFDIENPHHLTRSMSQTSKTSEDYFFRNQTKRSSEDYSYNNNRYEEDVMERSHSSNDIFKDEM